MCNPLRHAFVAAISAFLAFLSSPMLAQGNADQAVEDAKKIKAYAIKIGSQEFRRVLQPRMFGGKPNEQVSETRKWLRELQQFEENDLVELENYLETFEARYGTDREAIRAAFSFVKDRVNSPSFHWSEVKDFLKKPAQTRKQMAESMVSRAATHLTILDSFERKNPGEVFEEAREFLKLALEFSPGDAKATAI